MKRIRQIGIAIFPVIAIYIAEMIIFFSLLYIGLDSRWTNFLTNIARIAGAIIILSHFKPFSIKNPSEEGPKSLINFIFFSFAFLITFIVLTTMIYNPPFETIVYYRFNWFSVISGLFIASWTEEVIFRGWILGFLKKNGFNLTFAILLSSLLFGLWHLNIMNLNSWRQCLNAFILGILFSTIFIRFNDTIWFCIIFHFISHVCIKLFGILEIQRSDSITILIPSILVLAITSTILFKNRGNQWFLKPANKNKTQI